jgi:hypothetical protein
MFRQKQWSIFDMDKVDAEIRKTVDSQAVVDKARKDLKAIEVISIRLTKYLSMSMLSW